MLIGEFARRAGLSASAVRYYERVGLLPEPRRIGGRREYSLDALTRLVVIRSARALGCSIGEIRGFLTPKMSERPRERWEALAASKVAHLEAVIERSQHLRQLLLRIAQCRCESWDECATRLMARRS